MRQGFTCLPACFKVCCPQTFLFTCALLRTPLPCGRDWKGRGSVPEQNEVSGGMEIARSAYGTLESPVFAERSGAKSRLKTRKFHLKITRISLIFDV